MTLCGKGCGGASWGRESKNCLRGGDAGQTWRGKQELARQVAGASSAGVQSCRGVGAGRQCGAAQGSPSLHAALLSSLGASAGLRPLLLSIIGMLSSGTLLQNNQSDQGQWWSLGCRPESIPCVCMCVCVCDDTFPQSHLAFQMTRKYQQLPSLGSPLHPPTAHLCSEAGLCFSALSPPLGDLMPSNSSTPWREIHPEAWMKSYQRWSSLGSQLTQGSSGLDLACRGMGDTAAVGDFPAARPSP